DGTVQKICQPGHGVQKVAFNSHKTSSYCEVSISCPDGIIAHLHGPVPGSWHDLYLLRQSGLEDVFPDALNHSWHQFIINGDLAHGLKEWMVCPFKGACLSDAEIELIRV
ncbi:hypothetical protein BCR33DRAFT_672704, partial [Rhizoclosmatium globosum]